MRCAQLRSGSFVLTDHDECPLTVPISDRTRLRRRKFGSCNKIQVVGDGDEAEVIVAKNRNGPTGMAKVWWFKEYVRFDSASRRE